MQPLPYFYIDTAENTGEDILLNEVTSKHIVQVLRMKPGDHFHLTDGQGRLLTAVITQADKKQSAARKVAESLFERPASQVSVAISLLKNNSRFEWFLEKAGEIGVHSIFPLICHRTERLKVRTERLRSILISAMLQSRQTFLPDLSDPMLFTDFLKTDSVDTATSRYIAHCEPGDKPLLKSFPSSPRPLILIGPEGDFTREEIHTSVDKGFQPVSLGTARLRTETAGLAAAMTLAL